ncbi:hypothetical protein COB52_04355 [Candidatus Kaiserbacteria bacterium]|nr:MAG: hypothetical protein COB52_04355 [Candidatus Kaiserbacteria bacterium]
MDFETDIVLAIVAVLFVFTLVQFSGFTIKDIGTISITAINRLVDNIVPFAKLLLVLVASRAMRLKLDSHLGLTGLSYSLKNPLLYMKLVLTLALNFLAGSIVFLLTGLSGSDGTENIASGLGNL